MSTFYPFGIPSTSSFAISASRANKIVNPNYTAPLAEYALYAPPGTRGIDATTCPPGFRNAYSPGGGFTPIPSNPNVLNRSQYLLCFGEPSPTPTPSITPTCTITPSSTPGATPSQSPTPSPTTTPPTTPQATVSMTPTVTPSRSLIPTIQLTIGGNIVGGFPDFWIVKSNVAVPVNVVVASGNPEFKGYFGTDAGTLANCTNGDPIEIGDTFPGATLLQNTTSVTAAGPGEIGTPITWRNSSVAFIDTNDGNGSQSRTTGATWTDANNYTWSLTITDQTCSTSYPT